MGLQTKELPENMHTDLKTIEDNTMKIEITNGTIYHDNQISVSKR